MIAAAVSIPADAEPFHLVDGPVVYFLMSGDECVYVGSSQNFLSRIAQHQRTMRAKPKRHFDSVRYISVSAEEMLSIELHWILELLPRHNRSRFRGSTKRVENSRLKERRVNFIAEKSWIDEAKRTAKEMGLSLSPFIRFAVNEQMKRDGRL